MPSKSEKQHNLMEAIYHDPGDKIAKDHPGISHEVAKEYHDADKAARQQGNENSHKEKKDDHA